MKTLTIVRQRPITTYLLFTLLFSSIVWLLTLHATDPGRIGGRIFGYGIMWCPALATLVTCRLAGRKMSALAWKWGDSRYMIACYLIPLLYSLVAYLIIWISSAGGFYNKAFVTQVSHELGWEYLPTGLFIFIFFSLLSTE